MTAASVDPLAETTLDSEPVYEGVVLTVRRDRVRLPNGREGIREWIDHPGAVMVVPEIEPGRLVMVRQFRYATGRAFLEFPAGRVDPGEEPLACARRELREETGFEAAEWEPLGAIHLCVGYSSERIDIFLARGLQAVGARPDEDEFLELLTMDFGAAERAALDGRITDAKTLCALYRAGARLRLEAGRDGAGSQPGFGEFST